MKADITHECLFMTGLDTLGIFEQDLQAILQKLNDRFALLIEDLGSHGLTHAGLRGGSALAGQVAEIDGLLKTGAATWARQWADLQPVQALAHAFEAHAILLVFGKFNAGKSSFCNFLAERFAAQGKAVGYFHLDAGRIVERGEPFKEGATETTAQLQGVRLGEKLVLLDTPGLHSVTPENAALTQRFTDSADCVLWLTSSAAPGQVQELDDLARELARAKPLLPVVTRSDRYEEDEIDGALVKCLCNKSWQNRAQQEADVARRAQEKLAAMGGAATSLKPPVSISVHMARTQGQTSVAMEEAGFQRLYAALLAIAEPALAYKRRKPAETLLHHLEEHVLNTLCQQLLPALEALNRTIRAARQRLEQQREQVIGSVWREVVPLLAELLERHADARAVPAICEGLSRALWCACARAEDEQLVDYLPAPSREFPRIAPDEGIGFEELVVEEGEVRQVVGVDYARLYAELEKQLRLALLDWVDTTMARCLATIATLADTAAQLDGVVRRYERALFALKAELRASDG